MARKFKIIVRRKKKPSRIQFKINAKKALKNSTKMASGKRRGNSKTS